MFIDEMNVVIADLTSGFIKALKYLKTNGHERIAFFFYGDKNKNFFPSYLKFIPFIYQMAGLSWDEDLFWGEEFGYNQHQPVINRAISHFLKMKKPPTAILLPCDFYAIGFYSEIHMRGIKIPDDISIIGCLDSPMCNTLAVPLSSLRVCPEAMAKETISIINDNLANPQTPVRKVSISPELVIRESVRKI
jgi:LacI family transcriptional regulator